MVAAFASRMACAPARLLLAAAVVCYSVEMVRSEAAHHGVGGSMIRVGTETPFALATEEKEFTSTLLHRWGLGSQRLFAELAEPGVLADDVIRRTVAYSAVVVVVAGNLPPVRRNVSAGQPFLQVEPAPGGMNDALEHALPVQALNSGAELLERALGRPLFPLKVVMRSFGRDVFMLEGPMVVYDFSEGTIYLDRGVSRVLRTLPNEAVSAVAQFAEGVMGGVASAIAGAAQLDGAALNGTEVGSGIGSLCRLMAGVGGSVLTAVLVAQVPIWFCVACPVVLGLMAPFLFNLGSGAVAQALCDRLALPPDECNDVWYGAFAVAMVLSLASAIPIVFVCRLPECARRQLVPEYLADFS